MCGGHGRTYLLTSARYPDLRLLVHYLSAPEYVAGVFPAVVQVDEAWLSDDGFFRNRETSTSPAPDIRGFTALWLQRRPVRSALVTTVWLKRSAGGVDFYGVLATDGDPIARWEAEFRFQRSSKAWDTDGFRRMSVTIPPT